MKNYVSALFAKLGMERRTQAAAYAARVFDDPRDGHESWPRARRVRDLFPRPRSRRRASCLHGLQRHHARAAVTGRVPAADGWVPLGRIVYTRQALPAVELVNFALDDGDIIIRTDRAASSPPRPAAPSSPSRRTAWTRHAAGLERDHRRVLPGGDRSGRARPATDHWPWPVRARATFSAVRPLPRGERALIAMGVAALATHAITRRGRLVRGGG